MRISDWSSDVCSSDLGFAVDVTVVRRSPPSVSEGPDTLGPDQWRARLGAFDWVILAVPATPETDGMIGAAELAAMKPSATLINIARGSVVDQNALVAALDAKRIAARSEEHTSELQSLMRLSYDVF